MRQKVTQKTLRVTLGMTIASLALAACNSDNAPTLPPDVRAVMFLQRAPRGDQGNVFDYTSYAAGGRLVMLEPPSADGKLTVIYDVNVAKTHDDAAMINDIDIQSYDLSFDGKSVVFAASNNGGKYQLYSMNLDGTNFKQLTAGGNDHLFPTVIPGGKVLFMTNAVDNEADPDANQFRDEYERQTTAQVGTINADGSGELLGARNVSHRVSPALLPDGSLAYTEWRHMGGTNDGHLRLMNTDMTGMREAFGGEDGGNGGTNSYLKARHVQTTQVTIDGQTVTNQQLVAIATSRDRTIQSGKLILIDLNGSEANSKFTDLTPLVPGGNEPSQLGVGRYYDAEPIGSPGAGQFLVSWANGPVETRALAMAHSEAQFGIYLFDSNLRNSATGGRFPIFDDPAYWDVLARPIKTRPEPTPVTSLVAGATDTTIGALNVYNSSVLTIKPDTVSKVRLLEGFSGEEGIGMFGTTEFDGQSLYGEIPLRSDNSFVATVPGNVPFHIQLIDKFALSVANESIWISGRSGEQRVCGGCHENRTTNAVIQPGVTLAALGTPQNLVLPRAQRVSKTAFLLSGGNVANAAGIKGVPWDTAIQPILDAKCASCHDGTPSATNPSYTVTDNTTGAWQTFVFDLRGQKLSITIGEKAAYDYTASYISLMGLGELLGDADVTVEPAPKTYVVPASAQDSLVIQKLNPPQRFPTVDMNVRRFMDMDQRATLTRGKLTHAADVGGPELTADEYYLLSLNIDMGGQFFFRENLDSAGSGTP